MNAIERELSVGMDFQLYVSEKEFNDYVEKMQNYYDMRKNDSPEEAEQQKKPPSSTLKQ